MDAAVARGALGRSSGASFVAFLCCLTLEIVIEFILYVFALRHRSSSTV